MVATVCRTRAAVRFTVLAVLLVTVTGPFVRPVSADVPPAVVCHAQVMGSTASATCFNAGPVPARVRLHIECDRWWDPDVDGPPAGVARAQAVTLTDRCWKEIRSVWITRS